MVTFTDYKPTDYICFLILVFYTSNQQLIYAY